VLVFLDLCVPPFADIYMFLLDALPFADSTLPFADSALPFVDSTLPFADSLLPFADSALPFAMWCRVAVPAVVPAGGAADCMLGLGAVACGRGASCGITPGGGGEGVAAGACPAGGCPPVGGPLCAIASDVPPKSSATIARVFMVVIYTSGCFAPHSPGRAWKTRLGDRLFRVGKKEGRVSGPPSIHKHSELTGSTELAFRPSHCENSVRFPPFPNGGLDLH